MTGEPHTPKGDPTFAVSHRTAATGRGRRVVFALLGVSIVGAAGLFAAGVAGFAFSLDQAEHAPSHSADGIVALTGGAQRIEDAVDLLARGFGRRLLITGVNARTSREEIARLTPKQRALLECCVDLDYRAQNTVGNAVETRRWARHHGFKSLIVVTSNYHMPRTMTELDRVLPDTVKSAHSVVTPLVDPSRWWTSPAAVRVLAAEYAKYVASSIRRRVAPPPADDALAAMPAKVVADPVAAR